MTAPAERRVPLNRERVLQAAMRLVDEGGLEALSMRKLGQALGVEAMSLYNHVANKDDILDGMVDLVLREFELPSPGKDWEAEVRRCAISGHDALLRHPWACNLILSTTRIRPARLEYMEALFRTFRESGFSPQETSRAYHAIDSHILGYTLWQLGHMIAGGGTRVASKEELRRFIADFFRGFPIENYPYFLEHAEQHLHEGSAEQESEFEFGLRLTLDGLKRMRDAS
jgi:AcrR family transcriptional regulator